MNGDARRGAARVGWSLAVMVLLATAGCDRSQARSPSTLQIADACDDCTLTLSRVTTIDGRRTPELADFPYAIGRDRQGRLYIPQKAIGPPQIFDSAGRYVAPLARPGHGPGEITATGWIDAGRDDSIRVYSGGNLAVFGPNLEVVRQTRLSEALPLWNFDLDVLSDGTLLVTEEECSQDRCLRRVTARSHDGKLLRRFDPLNAGEPGRGRVAAARDPGTFWVVGALSGDRRGYQVTLFNLAGQALRVLEREPAYWTSVTGPERKSPTTSTAADVHEDASGRLIITVWQPKTDLATRTSLTNRPDFYDTIVEIIDPTIGRTLGVGRIPMFSVRVLDDGHIATYEDTAGFPMLEIWRVTQ